MSVIEAIKTRSSCAIMSDRDVAQEHIRKILDAAVCTPVHRATNPWRFLVIQGAGRHKLGDIMAERLKTDMIQNKENPLDEKNIQLLKKIREKPFRAPAIIAAAAAKPHVPKALMKENVASVSAACQNILLAASELGLSAIWRTGGLTYDPKTVEALGFDTGSELVGFIYLGHPIKAVRPKVRETSEIFTRWMTE